MSMLDQETIVWYSADAPPDVDTTVLVYAPGSDEPVWLGYFDGARWRSSDAVAYGQGSEDESVIGFIDAKVEAWAPMPSGAVCSEEGCKHCGSIEVNPRCPECNGIERGEPA